MVRPLHHVEPNSAIGNNKVIGWVYEQGSGRMILRLKTLPNDLLIYEDITLDDAEKACAIARVEGVEKATQFLILTSSATATEKYGLYCEQVAASRSDEQRAAVIRRELSALSRNAVL